jgi:peptide/nickel transport system ATP-binding protein
MSLEIRDLKVHYRTSRGPVRAVDGVSLEIGEGESLGLVGESGCGKTTLGLSLLGLLPPKAVVEGEILFNGEDLTQKTEEEMRRVRWKEISMIFQAAMNALNPVYRVEDQILEAILAHEEIPEEEARQRVRRLFELVHLDPSRAAQYPHEYSGGMRQRAIIAMALACGPKLLIADEPTTALDVMTQREILEEIRKLRERLGMSLLYISHDLSLLPQVCHRTAVMYAGKIIESAPSKTLMERPLHPYTKGLMASYPSLRGPTQELVPMAGEPPNLLSPPPGCRFHPRCTQPPASGVSREKEPPLKEVETGHLVACHLYD